jgi:hypothetical protein
MAYIDFDHQHNTLKAIRGIISYDTRLEEKVDPLGFSTYTEQGQLKGICLPDYLSDLELKGIKAENYFKELLDNNNIPYLYIGQGPIGIERSLVLKDKMKSKRPDFLVNLPDIGILFYDVKCRKKQGFPNSSRKYFQVFKTEIEGLINLHEQLLVPVWVAFIDESIVSADTTEPEFYLAPISLIKRYITLLKSNLGDREFKIITSIRLPDELFNEIKGIFSFKVGISIVKEETAKSFANSYKGLIRRIEDKIKDRIRKSSVLKTHLAHSIIDETKDFAFKAEVEIIIKQLIDEKIIIYEPNKPLTLQGE